MATPQRRDAPPPPPDPIVVRDLLATLPPHSDDLRALASKRLRELLESLHLATRYDDKEHSVQIETTLAALGQGDHQVCTSGWLRRHEPDQTLERTSVRLTAEVTLPAKYQQRAHR